METKRPMVIAIAGGKGGVGKSLIASYLAQWIELFLKKRVLLVDFDLEGPNLHTILGVHQPPRTLRDYILPNTTVDSLAQVATSVEIDAGIHGKKPKHHLCFVPGLIGLTTIPLNALPISRLEYAVKGRRLEELKTDFVIIDLSAGADPFSLRVFGNADIRILVTALEQSALSDMYKFLATWVFQELRGILDGLGRKDVFEEFSRHSVGLTKYSEIKRILFQSDPVIAQAACKIISERLNINILFNRVPERFRQKGRVEFEGQQFEYYIPEIIGVPTRYIGNVVRSDEFDGGTYRFLHRLRPTGVYADFFRVFSRLNLLG